MSIRPSLWFLTLCLLLASGSAQAQSTATVLFAGDPAGSSDYREESLGSAQGGDELLLRGPTADRLPLASQARTGRTSGLLQYRHVAGGSWEMRVGVDGAPRDLSGADSLVLYLNAPAAVPGFDLPRFGLEDADGRRTAALPLAVGTRIGYNPVRSGFQPGSATDLILDVSYTSTLSPELSRPGYPEDLLITFADEPLDTSRAAIGAPALPSKFAVKSRSGVQFDFRFRDVNGDSTLSAEGEFIDVLLPDPDSPGQRATWRVEARRTPSSPPAQGDVYLLAVDNAGLDHDPATWQQVRLARQDFGPLGAFDLARVAAIRFTNGEAPTLERAVWFDDVAAVDRGPDPEAPPAPSDLAAQPGDSSVVLSWSRGAGGATYHVYRQSGTGAPFERLTTHALPFPSFADLDVESGASYTYVVRAVSGGVQSADSEPVSAVPQAGLPDAYLDLTARAAFDYFWLEANPANGLVKDRSTPGSPASIAAVGFGLSAVTVGIDRGWISRAEGVERVKRTLEFFWNAPQSATDPQATGYKGFFYHFLDMSTGRRAWNSELSTIDTALLLGGVLHARVYFDGESPDEAAIRERATAIYERVDWAWAQARPPFISMGWFPESGFIEHDWRGYNEAMILYLLALGSPTHPVEPAAWTAWTQSYTWATHYGYSFVEFPPLFGHQYSHVWVDFRGRRDAYMQAREIDYFENSRRATLAQRAYHVANPNRHPNYGPDEWGLTASDIPGGYLARGAPPSYNDEGTLAPTAPGGSIAFTPRESTAALRQMYRRYAARLWGPYGLRDAYNVSENWFAPDYLGIDQGPILLMIENLRTERVWDVFMQDPDVQRGLARAGFNTVSTDAPAEPPAPAATLRLSVSPNPARTHARIAYELPRSGHATLHIYDVLGREVRTLADEEKAAGAHAVVVDGSGLPAGLYLCVLRQNGSTVTRNLILLR